MTRDPWAVEETGLQAIGLVEFGEGHDRVCGRGGGFPRDGGGRLGRQGRSSIRLSKAQWPAAPISLGDTQEGQGLPGQGELQMSRAAVDPDPGRRGEELQLSGTL